MERIQKKLEQKTPKMKQKQRNILWPNFENEMGNIEHIKPEHRCLNCKTPLNFCHNYMLTDEEVEQERNKLNWWKSLFYYRWQVDTERQYWNCPACHEDYLIDLRKKKE